MGELYRRADIFCLPSWWEAMPLSVLEAMASGLPVVATDVGDVSRLVVDGMTGSLVPTRDQEALAAALGELVGCHERCEAMGEAGRRRAEALYSAQTMVASLCSLYDELTGAPG